MSRLLRRFVPAAALGLAVLLAGCVIVPEHGGYRHAWYEPSHYGWRH